MKYSVKFDLDFKRNPYKGKFFAIEGIDGSGKTIQSKLLARSLTKKGKKVFLTKNPTNSPLGKFIRKFLKGKIDIPMVSFQYVFSADRQIQQLDIIEHLKKGHIVISDRYFWSSVAYGFADKEGINLNDNMKSSLVTQSILSMYNQFIIPDATFYLNVPIKTGLSRRQVTKKKKEVYENMGKLKKIEKAYKWLLHEFPKEFIVLDAKKPLNEVSKDLLKKLEL